MAREALNRFLFFFFFLKIYFYYFFIAKADIQRGETERKIFRLMIHSPSERNGPCYANLKPGASSGSPTWVQGPKALGRPRLPSPGHRQGAGREAGLLGYIVNIKYILGFEELVEKRKNKTAH